MLDAAFVEMEARTKEAETVLSTANRDPSSASLDGVLEVADILEEAENLKMLPGDVLTDILEVEKQPINQEKDISILTMPSILQTTQGTAIPDNNKRKIIDFAAEDDILAGGAQWFVDQVGPGGDLDDVEGGGRKDRRLDVGELTAAIGTDGELL